MYLDAELHLDDDSQAQLLTEADLGFAEGLRAAVR